MAADTHNSEMETRITEAVRSRLSFFRKQSSSLTFEGVRRLLEKDMGVETFTLDAHKKIIKSLLQENFYSSEDEDACGNVRENENETEKSEVENSSRSLEHLDQNVKTGEHDNLKKLDNKLSKEQKLNESAIEKPDEEEKDQPKPKKADNQIIVKTGSHSEEEKDQPKPKKADNQIIVKTESHSEVTEAIIEAAVLKRDSYLRSQIESISLGGVRRLLEQDLQLEEKTLDVHKKLIANLVDKVLTAPPDESDSVKETKKKKQKKLISSKGKKNDSEEDEVKGSQLDKMVDSLESAEISRDDEEMGKNKKTLKDSKSKKVGRETLGSMNVKGRKRKKESENEDKKLVKKPKKKKTVEDEDAESLKSDSTRSKQFESGDEIDPENRASEDSDSGSSDNKEVKMERKKTSFPVVVHGEQVQHLKNIIKSCGMGVPPTVYKKAKQQTESKREAYLIHELVAILKKEGLSSNPTDKEIRAVKKRKERAKDLEGIDTTNIISDSRRRRAASDFFLPPPQYKVSNEDEEDSSDEEDSKSSEDDEPVIEEEESD